MHYFLPFINSTIRKGLGAWSINPEPFSYLLFGFTHERQIILRSCRSELLVQVQVLLFVNWWIDKHPTWHFQWKLGHEDETEKRS